MYCKTCTPRTEQMDISQYPNIIFIDPSNYILQILTLLRAIQPRKTF